MIKYDPETKSITLTEWVDWTIHIKPIYEEIFEELDDESCTPISADDLTDDQINAIMEGIVAKWEHEDWATAQWDGPSPDIIVDCARPVIEEWCNEHFNDF